MASTGPLGKPPDLPDLPSHQYRGSPRVLEDLTGLLPGLTRLARPPQGRGKPPPAVP